MMKIFAALALLLSAAAPATAGVGFKSMTDRTVARARLSDPTCSTQKMMDDHVPMDPGCTINFNGGDSVTVYLLDRDVIIRRWIPLPGSRPLFSAVAFTLEGNVRHGEYHTAEEVADALRAWDQALKTQP